jgi:DEAD/DEAH box helicase domain-containing protein
VDAGSADQVVHPGAVYLHLGESYLSDDLDHRAGEALVARARPGYLTQPQLRASLSITRVRRVRPLGAGRIHLGEVEVTSQVVGYLRRDELTGQVWDATPLDLPERRTRTTAVWWTLDPAALPAGTAAEVSEARLDAGVHAAEHLSLGLLPVFAPCDRWDIGAASDIRHPETEQITVFVHDQQAGGTGFADRAYAVAESWLGAARDRVLSCGCEAGCPACILSSCGSSRGLDKFTAAEVLALLVG